jgi:Spy/CpxP family protein refolding chaperone
MIGGIPVYGSRRKGVFALVARRAATMLLVGAAVAGVFFLSHIARPENTHQADDQEEQCRMIEESGEEIEGELSECQTKLARLRAIEHHQMSATPATLDSTHPSP